MSLEYSEILLKNYDAIFYWQRNPGESIIDCLLREHELLYYKPEPQGESICWDNASNGFYTLSEKSWAEEQVLFYYKRAEE